MYNPDLGTFSQRDPIENDVNSYRYCNNNPLLYNDPTGLLTEEYTGPCEIKLWFGDTVESRGGMGDFIGDNTGNAKEKYAHPNISVSLDAELGNREE